MSYKELKCAPGFAFPIYTYLEIDPVNASRGRLRGARPKDLDIPKIHNTQAIKLAASRCDAEVPGNTVEVTIRGSVIACIAQSFIQDSLLDGHVPTKGSP